MRLMQKVQMPRSVASDLTHNCLQMTPLQDTRHKRGTIVK